MLSKVVVGRGGDSGDWGGGRERENGVDRFKGHLGGETTRIWSPFEVGLREEEEESGVMSSLLTGVAGSGVATIRDAKEGTRLGGKIRN